MRYLTMLAVLWGTAFRPVNAADGKPLQRFSYEEKHMGILVKFTLYAPDEGIANKAAKAAFDRIADVDRRMSDYNPESELRQLCDRAEPGKAVPVSGDLFMVLKHAQDVSKRSHGAFDVTVGPVVRLWRRARWQKELPDADRLKEALQAVGYQKVKLDEKRRRVTLAQQSMRLDLGGIAKGYAGDAALAALRENGVSRVMIDAGGDLVLGDPPPGKAGWRIGIAPLEQTDGPPSRILEIKNAAVATSGDAFQFVEIAGTRYSHIVNPKTGLGLTQRSSVTIIAPTGMEADSLASAVSVLGPEAGLKLVESTKDTAAFIVLGEPRRTFASKRFADCLAPNDNEKRENHEGTKSLSDKPEK